MIIKSTIASDCKGRMYYVYKNMGKEQKEYLPKYRTRLSEYDAEELIDSLSQDKSVRDIYIYKIQYNDGRISLLANPNYPVGKFFCEDDD